MRRTGWHLPLAGLFLAALGACTSSTDSTAISSTIVTTSLAVRPDDFLGKVACTSLGGGMQSFVATATDVTDPAHPITLPSSQPTPCSQAVLFRYVLVGHIYTAQVDGYEQPADALVPVSNPSTGDSSSGSRSMLLRGEAEKGVVAPRWTSACGVAGVTALDDESVPMKACDPLDDHAPGTSLTRIALDPLSTLGALSCSGKPGGSVFAFDVLPESASLEAQPGIPCKPTRLYWSKGVSAGTSYTFQVHAYDIADLSTPGLLASCKVLAREGLTTLADCSLLAPIPAAD